MRIVVVVDANIILAALLGGKPSIILFDSKFEFITARFILKEVEKYIPFIVKKSGMPEKEIKEGLELLL